MGSVSDNLFAIQRQIDLASSGTNFPKPRLIAVSKTMDETVVREAIQAGQRVFGENRVQETARKFPELRHEYPDLEIHLIGPLQTNKVDDAIRLFDVIQTLDRLNLVEALAKSIRKSGIRPRLYIEINIGHEPQKAGIMPEDFPDFLSSCRLIAELDIQGLMCIPPQNKDPVPYFRQMRQMADQFCLAHLSMGMSDDFREAIQNGATEIRVGRALFGARVVP